MANHYNETKYNTNRRQTNSPTALLTTFSSLIGSWVKLKESNAPLIIDFFDFSNFTASENESRSKVWTFFAAAALIRIF